MFRLNAIHDDSRRSCDLDHDVVVVVILYWPGRNHVLGSHVEIILFSIVGIAVYFLSDRLLLLIEQKKGKPLENRSIVYFFIFFILIFASFQLIKMILSSGFVAPS